MKKALRKPPGTYHHGNLRRALLDAGLGLIERSGPDALTLREVARRAGVSQTAPYRHFEHKEALVAAVAEEGLRDLTEWLRLAAAKAPDPVRAFADMGVAYVRFANAHPAHFRVMFGPGAPDRARHPSLRAADAAAHAQLVTVIEAGQRSGDIVATDARELALGAWSLVHGLASLLAGGQLAGRNAPARTPARLAKIVTRTFFLGAGVR